MLNWPFLLDDACHLNLIARGRIVRSNSDGTAVEVTYHELRTSKRPSCVELGRDHVAKLGEQATALIVDSDLGFIFWLGAISAKSVAPWCQD